MSAKFKKPDMILRNDKIENFLFSTRNTNIFSFTNDTSYLILQLYKNRFKNRKGRVAQKYLSMMVKVIN